MNVPRERLFRFAACSRPFELRIHIQLAKHSMLMRSHPCKTSDICEELQSEGKTIQVVEADGEVAGVLAATQSLPDPGIPANSMLLIRQKCPHGSGSLNIPRHSSDMFRGDVAFPDYAGSAASICRRAGIRAARERAPGMYIQICPFLLIRYVVGTPVLPS